mmetsp:Transcript_37289/g.58723  ORF Transcript_37289/g.58723 Transcript_37289/m.58723 type:complete len:316 (-) Transcript_37289:11-958(-)
MDYGEDEIRQNYEQQLQELEVLESIYFEEGEFRISSPDRVLKAVRAFVEELSGSAAEVRAVGDLVFSFALKLEDDSSTPIVIDFTLPCGYPSHEHPSVRVRVGDGSRARNQHVTAAACDFVRQQDEGEMCITETIQFVLENAAELTHEFDQRSGTKNTKETKEQQAVFVRQYIYSHHIRGKMKRRDMRAMSKQYDLTGFILVSKPGVIVIEGWEENVSAFWVEIRTWQWKRIMSKMTDEAIFEANEDTPTVQGFLQKQRVFSDFTELVVQNQRNKPTLFDFSIILPDMGAVLRIAEERGIGNEMRAVLGLSDNKK